MLRFNKYINLGTTSKLYQQRISIQQNIQFKQQTLQNKLINYFCQLNIQSQTENYLDEQTYSKYNIIQNAPLEKIRNIAIIAHVDHGKTTLVDALLQQSGIKTQNVCQMDSNQLEQEKGITILSKITSIAYKDYKINIVDTPGHHDFGGEVERIMNIVDGVLLLVCATEGVMTQTRFVLQKAILQNTKIIVVINKADRDSARIQEVENEIFDLFVDMEVPDELMDYKVFYASGRSGWAVESVEQIKQNPTSVQCLFEGIVNQIQHPKVFNDQNDEFQLLVSQTESNLYFDKLCIGKVFSGQIKLNDQLKSYDQDGKIVQQSKVTKILKKYGTEVIELQEARQGDIIQLAGFSQSTVSNTITSSNDSKVIPCLKIDPPIISISINVNTAPGAGIDGKHLTKSAIENRLLQESENDVALKVEKDENNWIKVSGRGDLHIGMILEKIRREGYEMSISPPIVIMKFDEKGKKEEPVEKVQVDVDPKYTSTIIEIMNQRSGIYLDSQEIGKDLHRLKFEAPTRGLIGFRQDLLNETKGSAIIETSFLEYRPYLGKLKKNPKGALIATEAGECTAYAISALEKLGSFFVSPGDKTYQGMVVGEAIKDRDMDINPCKKKELNNIRTVMKEEKSLCIPPRTFGIEAAISYIRDDELVEVTPKYVRIRKQVLDKGERDVIIRKIKNATIKK